MCRIDVRDVCVQCVHVYITYIRVCCELLFVVQANTKRMLQGLPVPRMPCLEVDPTSFGSPIVRIEKYILMAWSFGVTF